MKKWFSTPVFFSFSLWFCLAYGDLSFIEENNFDVKQGDFGIWNYNVCIADMNDTLRFLGWTNFRYEKNSSLLYLFYQHLQLEWSIGSFFSIAPAYRQIFFRINKEIWVPIYYPNVNLSFFWKSSNILFRDRSRIVYATNSDIHLNLWVYRNKFSIISLKGLSPINIYPRAEAEIYIVEKHGLSEYRFSAVALKELFDHVRIEIGYRFLSEKIGHSWFNQNVLLLNIVGVF